MHVAHFVHRYPPALGGCEAYVERLSRYLAEQGDTVSVWTSTAIELEEMWRPVSREATAERGGVPFEGSRVTRTRGQLGPSAWERSPGTPSAPPRSAVASRLTVCRYRPLRFPGRRYLLKALSLLPHPPLQALTLPCNPVCPAMWRDAARYAGPIDAVHAFAFPYSFLSMCALRLARRRNVPFLLTPFLHLGDPNDPRDRTRCQYTSAPLRWLLRQADRVFVQTPSEFHAVVELGVPEERITLQGLGVDPAECTGGDRAAARKSWGVRDGEVVVGHLANLSREKGTLDLVQAAGNARVVLAGPEMPNVRHVPLPPTVTKLGPLTDTQKRDFFAGIDLFVLPSRTDSFGLVLLEAWANAKPVVCYHAGGPGDLVRHGEDGFLAKCGDITELAKCLTRLTTEGQLRQALGEAGRRRVGEEFRWADKLDLVRAESRQRPGHGAPQLLTHLGS